MVGALLLNPAVALAGFDVGAVMATGYVGECLHPKRPGVVHIDRPGLHQHICDGADHGGVIADATA